MPAFYRSHRHSPVRGCVRELGGAAAGGCSKRPPCVSQRKSLHLRLRVSRYRVSAAVQEMSGGGVDMVIDSVGEIMNALADVFGRYDGAAKW